MSLEEARRIYRRVLSVEKRTDLPPEVVKRLPRLKMLARRSVVAEMALSRRADNPNRLM